MGQRRKKQALFEQGAAALQALGAPPNEYACPICCRVFGLKHLYSGDLTAEHVPPKSVGGRAIILTCKPCNDRAGHSYDYALNGRQRIEDAAEIIRGGVDGRIERARVSVGGVAINAAYERKDGHLQFDVNARRNNLRNFEGFVAALNEGRKDVEFKIELRAGFDDEQVRLAELKSAFLACAAEFGYIFALSDSLSFIREQLIFAKEISYPVRRAPVRFIPTNSIFVDNNLSIVLVRFDRQAIILPLPVLQPDEFLRIISRSGQMSLQGSYGPLPEKFVARSDYEIGGTLRVL